MNVHFHGRLVHNLIQFVLQSREFFRIQVSIHEGVPLSYCIVQTYGCDNRFTKRHNDFIYYFRDLDELIIYGSVGFLSDYVRLLACRIKHSMTALQKYQTIYACFNEVAFVWPRVFYHMFFGNHHVDLGQVISTYYKVLYPEELQKIPDLALREMLQRGTLFERDEVMMDELVAEGTIRREDAALTLETIIALHERYLHQASLLKKEDPRPLEEAFQNVFLFVLEKISVKSSVSR